MTIPPRWRTEGGLLPLLLLAFALRLGWALFVPVEPVSDSAMYDAFAREIAAGRGYRYPGGELTAYWPVGAPALYGLFYAWLGSGGWVAVAVNLALGTSLVFCVHRLARLRFGDRAAFIAGLVTALWPTLIQFTTVIGSEPAFLFFVAAALAVREPVERQGWTRTAVSTALIVAAAYMRPTALPLAVLLPLLDWVRHRSLARTLLQLAVASGLVAALIAPWAARNQAVLGAPVLVSTNFGPNLWMGNNPQSHGAYMSLPPIVFAGEVERDAALKERALDFIAANPRRYLQLCLNRLRISFGSETIGVHWNARGLAPVLLLPLKLLSTAYWLLAFAAALAGLAMFVLRRPLRLLDPLVVTPALFTAVALLVVGQDRYHMPLIPFVAVFAGFAADRILARRLPPPRAAASS